MLAEFASQEESEMHCLVLSNICSTQITGKRNPSMWMSKLQLAKFLPYDCEMVSLSIEQPWQLNVMLGTLDAAVCTNLGLAL